MTEEVAFDIPFRFVNKTTKIGGLSTVWSGNTAGQCITAGLGFHSAPMRSVTHTTIVVPVIICMPAWSAIVALDANIRVLLMDCMIGVGGTILGFAPGLGASVERVLTNAGFTLTPRNS